MSVNFKQYYNNRIEINHEEEIINLNREGMLTQTMEILLFNSKLKNNFKL